MKETTLIIITRNINLAHFNLKFNFFLLILERIEKIKKVHLIINYSIIA